LRALTVKYVIFGPIFTANTCFEFDWKKTRFGLSTRERVIDNNDGYKNIGNEKFQTEPTGPKTKNTLS